MTNMPGKDTDANHQQDLPDAILPAGVAIGIIDADGTLKLANYGWCGDGRDRHAPKVLQVKPGVSCSQALRVLAQCGDESAKRVLQAFDWILSGVVRSIRCEFFEPRPEMRWFHLTISQLRDDAGLIITSIDVTARRRGTVTSAGKLPQRMRRLQGAPLLRTEIAVNRLVQEVIEVADSIARKHGVGIACALDRNHPHLVGDALLLHEMLMTLVLDAVDVTVRVNPEPRSIHVTTTHTASTVEICVKHRCPDVPGNRIRTSLVRTLAHTHGGSLAAHRLGNHGLSMQITLPAGGQGLIASAAAPR
jgi:hypothetical protein